MRQTFLPKRDREVLSSLQKDYYRRAITKVMLFKADKGQDIDSLYLERENDFDSVGNWVEVNAYIRFDPQHIETKKEGTEQFRSISLDFSVDTLAEAGIEKPGFGDIIRAEGELYKVTEFRNQDYVNHDGGYLTHHVVAVKIRQSSLFELKLEDYTPPDTTLGSKKDFNYYRKYQTEFFLKMYPKVAVYLRPENVEIDTLYREIVEENKLDWIRYDYPAGLTLRPQEMELKRFGIEKWRDCKLVVSLPLLERFKFPFPSVDSVFAAEREFYKITDVIPVNYVTGTNTPLNLVLLGLKYRPPGFSPDEVPNIEQSRTLFAPEHDIRYASMAYSEFNERSFSRVQFIDRDRNSRDFDILYLEDVEDWKTKGIRYKIPCYVRLDPQEKVLKRFGIDTERDIHISLSKELADKFVPKDDNELGNQSKRYPGIGTVVVVEEESYVITDALPQYYFGNVYNNQDRSLGIILFGKKLRSSSFDSREKVFDADEEPEPELPPYLDDYL